MANILSWINLNWFSIVQALGIIAGLVFTAASFRQVAKGKEVENLLSIAGQHRELWSEARERPELSRILQERAELEKPITVEEEEFLNLAIVHFETGWRLAREGTVLTPQTLARDARGFFSLPLPRAVWEKTKQFRNRKFVRFVEQAMASRAEKL